MDEFARILIRMALWVRRPPSKEWVYAAIGVAVLAAVIVSLEYFALWPEWASAERFPRTPVGTNR